MGCYQILEHFSNFVKVNGLYTHTFLSVKAVVIFFFKGNCCRALSRVKLSASVLCCYFQLTAFMLIHLCFDSYKPMEVRL